MGLFLLSAALTGFLGFLISQLQYESGTKFGWWIGIATLTIVISTLANLIVYLSHEQ